MRGEIDEDYYRERVQNMLVAVERAPRVRGIVWRGIYDNNSYSNDHDFINYWQGQVGTVLQWSSFSSASGDPAMAAAFAADSLRGVVFEILTSSGRYIAPVSQYSDEEEVILMPNAKYLVTGIIEEVDFYAQTGNPRQRLVVQLMEMQQ